MNDILKQRLVGALILVALGVVFWPIIFVEPETPPGAQQHIPPRPQVDTSPVTPPDRAGLRASPPYAVTEQETGEQAASHESETALAGLPEGARDPNTGAAASAGESSSATTNRENSRTTPPPARVRTPAIRTQAPVTPVLDEQGLPKAWVLQIASVSSKATADQLRKRLQTLGHKAYVTEVRINGRALQRVYIGPKVERAALAALQREIDAEFRVTSIVKRYVP